MRGLIVNPIPLMRYGLIPGLRQAGIDCLLMEGDYRIFDQSAARSRALLAQAIDDFAPDFVLSEGFFRADDPGWMREVRDVVAPATVLVYWAIDDPTFGDLAATQVEHYDCVLTTAAELLPTYRAAGKTAELFLFACNPEFHRQVPACADYACDLSLVANNYPERGDVIHWFLVPLVERGFDVKVWGRWWDDPSTPVNLLDHPGVYQGVLPYEETPAVYASAKIVLGLNFDDTSATQTARRPYEVLACGGGLYLGHYTKAQENVFGPHILQSRNATETVAQVERVLSLAEGERRALADRGQRFVYEHHTYQQRASILLSAVEEAKARRSAAD